MPPRYQRQESHLFPRIHLKPFFALRESFKQGYHWTDFKSDLMAGIVVSMVAIPLSMALAIASGVSPQYGLYTVMVGGGIVALLGGSRFQVTGPTAAFVAILVPIAQKFGFPGLLVAGFLSGIILILMGLMRMGKLIQFIPYPVTTGFTSGIAVVIATLQVKDFLGLNIASLPERFHEKLIVLFQSLGTFSLNELMIGALTLFVLILWPKVNRKVPAPLVALSMVSIFCIILQKLFPGMDFQTIGSRFSFEIAGEVGHGIPQALPSIDWPWNFRGSDGQEFILSLEMIEALIPSAFVIAMLGAIESLLSAVVADGMTQTKHNPDAELIGLGIGNALCPFFGGIPATGAIARTTTNIRFGARTPIASFIHALFTLFVILLFAPYVSYLPMASMAALLLVVAYNMSERKHFVHILKVAPKSDVAVLLICFSLTVMFDMVVGVTVGIVLASLLFMQRMARVTGTTKIASSSSFLNNGEPLPPEIVLYDIAGPLFFGAAEKAAEAMADITDDIKGVIFLMNKVPTMDVTGLVALESAMKKLNDKGKAVYLVGLNVQPAELINKSGLLSKGSQIFVHQKVEDIELELSE